MNKKSARKITGDAVKIEAIPLSEEQIAQFLKFYKKNKTFPGSKIPCSITGKLTTCMGPWMEKKIEEFGGAENFLRNYKCRGAMKTQRLKDKPAAPKRKKKPKPKTDSQNNYIIPKVQEPVRCPLGESDVRNITKSQCLRPDIYLNNNRNCEGCSFYKNCECKLKCLPKGVDFDGEYFVCSKAKNKKQ